jgi:hypothetical protein
MLPATLLTSPGVLRAAFSTTGPKALVASDFVGRIMFSSRAVNVVSSVLVHRESSGMRISRKTTKEFCFCRRKTRHSLTRLAHSHVTHTPQQQNQTHRRAPLRQPPAERERIRDKLREQHDQAVAQVRELERRAKLHKPVVDIPAPHIGEHQDIENALHHIGVAALIESRQLQSRTQKSMPRFLSLEKQWKIALGEE